MFMTSPLESEVRMIPDLFVTVIMPVCNQGNIVASAIDEVVRVLSSHYIHYELIIVDDASTDSTVDVVLQQLDRYEGIRLLRLSRCYGREIAVTAGLESSIGDYVVIIAPETDPPDLIPSLISRCQEVGGVVYGVTKESQRKPFLRGAMSRLFHVYLATHLGINLQKSCTHYRVMSRQMVNAIIRIKDRYQLLRLASAMVGYQSAQFEYEPLSSSGGRRWFSLWSDIVDGIEILLTITKTPLRWFSYLGFVASALNVVYAIYVFLIYFLKENVAPGWATLSLQQSGMFFFLFLILAVLCEYVGRIMEESLQRPLYNILEERNSAVMIREDARTNVISSSKDGILDRS